MSGVFNIAKGRVHQFALNVEANSPAGCCFRVIPYYSTDTEDAMLDTDTVAALEALANTAERTGNNWNRKQWTATEVVTPQVDDTNNWVDLDSTDCTWDPGPTTGNNVSHLVVAYDPDGTNTDANSIPCTLHTWAVTTDGNPVVAQLNVEGFYRAQ